MCICFRCEKYFDNKNMFWTKDWHNIPFHHVCQNCFEKQQEEDFANHYEAIEPIEPED